MSEDVLNFLLNDATLNLELILSWMEKPAPFTPGEHSFWDDPYISQHLLATHLDTTIDRASRRPETIDRSVNWIIEAAGLKPGAAVLDMGCGPGLYTSRLARRGMKVTGVDYSPRSIEYAEQSAQEQGLDIHYRCENYLDLADEGCYDVVMLIFGDFCPLSPEQRKVLLGNVRRALKPGGHFIFDVSTREHRKRYRGTNGWYIAKGGFWKPGPHLVLEHGFDYPEGAIYLDQVIVIEADGKLSLYRMWFQDYTPETIAQELAEAGFSVKSLWGDLTGTPHQEDSEWIGLVTQFEPGYETVL